MMADENDSYTLDYEYPVLATEEFEVRIADLPRLEPNMDHLHEGES